MQNKQGKSAVDDMGLGDSASAQQDIGARSNNEITLAGLWSVECLDKDGNLKWVDEIKWNLVVDEGLDEILEQFFNGATYTALHYIGLTDGTPTVAAGDTMASHAGWAEVTAYSESVRQTYNPAAAASKSITNSASKAVFSVNGTATAGGLFMTTVNTKGGSTGVLVSAGAFAEGDKAVDSGDTLNVTATYNGSSS